jgi:hypothetical protein
VECLTLPDATAAPWWELANFDCLTVILKTRETAEPRNYSEFTVIDLNNENVAVGSLSLDLDYTTTAQLRYRNVNLVKIAVVCDKAAHETIMNIDSKLLSEDPAMIINPLVPVLYHDGRQYKYSSNRYMSHA